MIKTIIFDLGGVLVPEKSDYIIKEMTNFLGLPFDEVKKPFMTEITSGEMTLLEMYKAILKNSGKNISPESALKKHIDIYWDAMAGSNKNSLNIDRNVLELVETLKQKFKVVCLTNTEKEIAEINKARGRIFEHFENAYISPEMGSRKPEAEIYNKVLDDLNNKPSEVIFIDDNLEYVKGAEKLGIRSIQFKDVKQLKKELSDILKNSR